MCRESLVQLDCTPNAWAFFLFPVPRDTCMGHQALETVAPSQPGGWRVGSPAQVGWASCRTDAAAQLAGAERQGRAGVLTL